MLIMIGTVSWGMIYKLRQFYQKGIMEGDRGSQVLFVVGGILLLLAVWMVIEAVAAFRRYQLRRAETALV